MNIADCIRKCDSWSEVEDRGVTTKDGRYSVVVFFETHEDADDFRECVKIETVK
jgi:hypothetical protein